jgi:hypothetical protein
MVVVQVPCTSDANRTLSSTRPGTRVPGKGYGASIRCCISGTIVSIVADAAEGDMLLLIHLDFSTTHS